MLSLLLFIEILAIYSLLLSSRSVAAAYDSVFSLSQGQRYVALSGVAYCTDPIFGKDTVTNWSCNACRSFPSISNATTFHGSKSDANGYVAYDAAANEVIVSFSGTDPLSIKNWLADIDFVQQSYPLCNGCLVHKGFYQSYLSVAPTVVSLVKGYLAQHPSASIAVTGHSLGAAMAAHAMADFVGYKKFGNTNVKTSYTYGMPRVGNDAFQTWYVGALPGTFRVVHQKDPVPQLPPQSFTEGNYHHMPYEVFYTSDYNNWKLCSKEGEDATCSDQYTIALDVLMHLNYLDFDFTTNYLSCKV